MNIDLSRQFTIQMASSASAAQARYEERLRREGVENHMKPEYGFVAVQRRRHAP
jgi:hypothetical protein